MGGLVEVVQGEFEVTLDHLGRHPMARHVLKHVLPWRRVECRLGRDPYTACAWRVSAPAPMLRPTETWHRRMECHGSIAVSPFGAFAWGLTCRTGSP